MRGGGFLAVERGDHFERRDVLQRPSDLVAAAFLRQHQAGVRQRLEHLLRVRGRNASDGGDAFGVDVLGGGLGELRGKVWRVGLMGESSTEGNVLLFLSTLGKILREQGFQADTRAALDAATTRLGQP